MISAGFRNTSALKTDGSVLAVGYNTESFLSEVAAMSGIVAIQQQSYGYNVYGILANGTVVAAGADRSGEISGISGWTDIVQVAAGGDNYEGFAIGLKSDGTVVHSGNNYYGQDGVTSWTDIIQIATGFGHCLGLKSDGTVVATGLNNYSQSAVGSWTDIVQVAAGHYHTVGLKSDGTVVAVGWNNAGQVADVSTWTDIISIGAGYQHSLGVKSDGTVEAVGYDYQSSVSGVSGWTDIIQVDGGYQHTVGLKSDGTAVGTGSDSYSESSGVSSWTGIATDVPGIDPQEPPVPLPDVVPEEGVKFLLTLTGAANGTTDVYLPMSSLNARIRSEKRSYLQVTIPYTDERADAISLRPNGDLQLVYVDADGAHDVVDVALETVQESTGASSKSIVLTGHRQSTNAAPSSHTVSATSRQTGATSTITVPGYRPEILPADDITSGGITITAGLVSLSASISDNSLNIQTVYSEGS